MGVAKAYKLFRRAGDGGLRPLYVLASETVPLGVWLSAEEGPKSGDGHHVRSRLGPLAYRPGWHLCELPMADHIGRKDPSGSGRLMQAPDTVWAEVEYHTDVDYGPQAGRNGLNRIPEGGYYRFKTNPKAKLGWIVCGELRVVRILSDDDVAATCAAAGIEPQPKWRDPVDAAADPAYNGRKKNDKEDPYAL